MTPEARLDRLERIAEQFVHGGAKADERFAKLEEQTDQTLKVVTELLKERRRNGKS